MVAAEKRTYRIEFAAGRKTIPLVAGCPNRPDAEAVLRGIAKRMGWAPEDLVVVGSRLPAPTEEAAEGGE